jgi:hypothetical protein
MEGGAGTFRLNWLAFLAAFALGIGFVYLKAPEPTVIVRMPTPFEGAGKRVYTDAAGDCFTYESQKVQCTADAKPQKVATSEPKP